MMKQITKECDLNTYLMRKSWRGRQMYAYYRAYGLDYPFCRFYAVGETGVLLHFNSTMYIISADAGQAEDLAAFIRMHIPHRVECDEPVRGLLAALLPEYLSLHRTTFELHPDTQDPFAAEEFVEFNPSLEEVYKILQAGFPNLTDFPLWYTDTSHRCRHGVSHVMTYKGSTTASIVFDIDDHVLVGQVATLPEARGLGHARCFLRWLAAFLAQFDKQAVLYALDIRESFYREVGFTVQETEFVLERAEDAENITKGRLDNGNT
ncbi:MAG: GNAT family N-acetyltransferase [Oscillospiraceae bacterium]|nr:GNAT family N-acetyltransferase [Oscillospiraceae bacterium]